MGNEQFYALSGKRPKTRFADMIRAEVPQAKQNYFNKKASDLANDQFQQEMELTAEQIEEQRKQSQISTGVSTVGLGAQAYDTIFAEGAAPAVEGLGAYGAGEAGSVAGLGAESGSAGMTGTGTSGLSGLGYIAAIAAAQKGLSNATGTEFEGQPTRDALYFNPENENFEPAAFNDPWHGYINQQFGNDVSSGQKMDARIYNNDWAGVLKSVPGTANQWVNPVGDAVYDTTKGIITNNTGLGDQSADLLMGLVDPISAVGNLIEDVSFVCSAANRVVGLERGHMGLLNDLLEYSKVSHPNMSEHYFTNAPKLVSIIAEKETDLHGYYTEIIKDMISPVVARLKDGCFEDAYTLYIEKYIGLLNIYAPELTPGYAKAQMPAEV